MVNPRSLLTSAAFGCLILTAASAARAAAEPPPPLQSTLRHIAATVSPSPLTLANATQGKIEARFALSAEARASSLRMIDGATLRVHVPDGSGIFLRVPAKDQQQAQGGIEALVPLARAGDDLTAAVAYEVDPRARVRNYPIYFDLAATLAGPNGAVVQDSGRVTVPSRVETPLRTKIIVLSIIGVAIFLFIVEWVRVDVVAILMMVSLPLLGLLHSRTTFTGLSSNAVIAIIGVMIVSAGLNRVGLVARVVRPVIRLAGKSGSRLMIFLSGLIAMISSVMQNTGAAVLFLPGIRQACKEINIPISRILMPIGMCAILGGTLTMIGTSPLILLNDILPAGMSKFSLLELTPIGAALVIGGITYFTTGGGFFLRSIVKDQQARRGGSRDGELAQAPATYHDLKGPFELLVPKNYRPKGNANTVIGFRRDHLVHIVAVRDGAGLEEIAPPLATKIKPGYSICVYGTEENVQKLSSSQSFELLSRPRQFRELFNPAVAATTEAVVSPRSSLIGKTIQEIHFRKTYGVTALALYREGRTYYTQEADIPLMAGDAILLHGTWERFHALQEAHRHFIFTEPLNVEVQNPGKSGAALFCFLGALTLMLVSSFYFQGRPYNPIPLSVCLMAGALGMVVTGVISIHEAYQSVDWRTVFLLGGLIPLGMAVDNTGTAEWIARGVVAALGGAVSPLVLLIVLATLAGIFCLVISNVGACTLLVPLGVSMANQIGIDPRVAAIVVGIGVSNSFLLPTHQVNALYMGPGDYRTKDYMKIGGVMSVLYIVLLVTMTYLFYL